MIKLIKTTTEEIILSEIRGNTEYSVVLTIDYKNSVWTIEPDRLIDCFIYKNTRNYNAGIITSNLIREATFIAWQRLGLTQDQADELNLPF